MATLNNDGVLSVLPPDGGSGIERAIVEQEDALQVAGRHFLRQGHVVILTMGSISKKTYPKLEVYGERIMAKKEKNEIGDWKGIARVPFNSPERDAFVTWLKSEPDIFLELSEIIAQDYKLSLSYDSRSDAIMASLSCYNAKEPNYKMTLVSRAPTFWDALCVTVFKHTVLCEGKWNDAPEDSDKWG